MVQSQSNITKKRKRCPNGSRRDKITKLCRKKGIKGEFKLSKPKEKLRKKSIQGKRQSLKGKRQSLKGKRQSLKGKRQSLKGKKIKILKS